MTDFSLQDRVILLTGAAGYLGSAIARGLADARAEVILAGRTKLSLDELRDDIVGQGGNARSLVVDISRNDSHGEAVQWIQQQYGRLDGIVNNAYRGRAGTLDMIDADDFSKACSQNLSGPFNFIQQALPILQHTAEKNKGGASIVNIASMYGKVSPDPCIYGDSGQNNPVHYGATKAGLIQMTRYLACHLADKSIRVNSISPGAFPRQEIKQTAAEFLACLEQKIPMGRIGQAAEVVGPVLFLLSPASSYVTGIDLPVDGGWTAW